MTINFFSFVDGRLAFYVKNKIIHHYNEFLSDLAHYFQLSDMNYDFIKVNNIYLLKFTQLQQNIMGKAFSTIFDQSLTKLYKLSFQTFLFKNILNIYII